MTVIILVLIASDCTNQGYDLYLRSDNESEIKVNLKNALGHNYVNGVCEQCGKVESLIGDVNGDEYIDIEDVTLLYL